MAHVIKGRKNSALVCNVCGKDLRVEKGILLEDCLQVTKEWGFFSKQDLEVHKFVICEECYTNMISQFKIPVERYEKKEAL